MEKHGAVNYEVLETSALIVLEGEIDGHHQNILEKALEDLLRRGYSKIIIDMEKASYVSLLGLEYIAIAVGQLADRGGKLYLCHTSNELQEILAMIRSGGGLDICKTRAEALARCDKPGK